MRKDLLGFGERSTLQRVTQNTKNKIKVKKYLAPELLNLKAAININRK